MGIRETCSLIARATVRTTNEENNGISFSHFLEAYIAGMFAIGREILHPYGYITHLTDGLMGYFTLFNEIAECGTNEEFHRLSPHCIHPNAYSIFLL